MFLRILTLGSVGAVGIFLLPGCGGGSTSSNLPTVVNAVATSQTSSVASPAQAQAQANTLLSWSNGQQIPASFMNADFNASGPLYQQLSASPQLDPNSANYISYYFAGNAPEFEAGYVDSGKNQAPYDYNFPLYIALPSDPVVTIVCSHQLTAPCMDENVQIRMPSLAQQAGGTDHHLAVLEPSGLEYDFWLVATKPPYFNGSPFSASGEGHFSSAGSNYGPNFVAPGFDVGAAGAAGEALSSLQIYTSELAAGVINHALSFLFPCSTNAWVYPASQPTGTCANGAGMPLGSRIWWQPTDSQTNAMSLPRDMKTVLTALHHYGGFFTNDSEGRGTINGQGGGMAAHFENQEPYWIYGNGRDPALAYALSAQGWVHITVPTLNPPVDHYLLTVLGSDVDFLDNLKVLAPCITQRTC